MGRQGARIDTGRIETYLRNHGFHDANVHNVRPLGEEGTDTLKSYGYGAPLRVTFEALGQRHDVVLRTMAPDPFGHDRRGDRASVLVQAYEEFGKLPRHIRPLDVGAFDDDGNLHSIPRGELFLLTEYVPGRLYAEDLEAVATQESARDIDLDRAVALADYLVEIHQQRVDPARWARELRDTVGSGEGIFGLCDSYPEDHPIATTDRLLRIEEDAVRWRWKLKRYAHRARRTHGDFHPFNILFREGADFSVLDASRGLCGEPADDVTCLSINYLFFALQKRPRFEGALREVWNVFWRRYLDESGDLELLNVVAPFFAWRSLVIASPVWYPAISDELRDRLLRFAEQLLAGVRFQPFEVEALLT